MHKSGDALLSGLLLGCLIALPLTAAEPAPDANAEGKSDAQLLEAFRDDLQAVETEVLSKAISLTEDERAKFWPVFQKFQAEQKAIIDAQVEAIRKYAAGVETLSDADAQAYVGALLERDQRIHDLRVKYLAEYSKVLPAGKAARVIHISRRLGVASQAHLAGGIPLVR